jgi:hypothetical protein
VPGRQAELRRRGGAATAVSDALSSREAAFTRQNPRTWRKSMRDVQPGTQGTGSDERRRPGPCPARRTVSPPPSSGSGCS